ncbi:MAG: hypothetical protein EAZ92_14925 [Candidatus Kapaibacterium sp.]|nr:MAG: hypothetical protein EAZ92_14925 [Candidatus Kapabacteria bacterium]
MAMNWENNGECILEFRSRFTKQAQYYTETSSVVAQTFLSVSVYAGFRRQTQTRMSVPLKTDFIRTTRVWYGT